MRQGFANLRVALRDAVNAAGAARSLAARALADNGQGRSAARGERR
jgi:hypothetical protein